jgi:hypothetical protein
MDNFDTAIYQRGKAYHKQDVCKEAEITLDRTSVSVTVQGTQKYFVQYLFSDEKVYGSCNVV